MDLYNAVNVYLLNTAKALELLGNERSYLIKYEDLVTKPEDHLTALCEFLDVEYYVEMLEPKRLQL